jgi:hypothetical protein
MEREGAEVVGYDLSEADEWDIVPFARSSNSGFMTERKDHIRKLNNAFWLCHRVFESRARMVYGDVYSIPAAIGSVDICTCCSILLHVRDPFRALEKALSLTRETIIVTEPAAFFRLPSYLRSYRRLLPSKLVAGPAMEFLPDWRVGEPNETWWRLSPEIVQRFIGTLGFEKSTVTHHSQLYHRGRMKLRLPQFTVVGHRTA